MYNKIRNYNSTNSNIIYYNYTNILMSSFNVPQYFQLLRQHYQWYLNLFPYDRYPLGIDLHLGCISIVHLIGLTCNCYRRDRLDFMKVEY